MHVRTHTLLTSHLMGERRFGMHSRVTPTTLMG